MTNSTERLPASRRRILVGACVLALVAVIVAMSQLTLFVVQPIGAVPEGRTLVLWRRSANLTFIDSADAFCERMQNGVSLLCRIAVLGAVMKNNEILLRLPYSSTLYYYSTGGKTYNR